MEIYKALQEHFKKAGMSQIAIAEKLGVSKAYINALLSGRQRFGKRQAEIWSETFGLSKSWLLTGEGEMLKDNTSSVQQTEYEIPLLDLDASAGFSMVNASGDNNRRMLTLPKCDGAIPIVGNSMLPTIHDGDIAVFDMVNSPSSIRPDGVYIVQYNDDEGDTHLTVKRVKHSPKGDAYIRLSADNPEYGYEDVHLQSITRVAKVLYTINKLSY